MSHMTTSPCANQLPSRALRGERKNPFCQEMQLQCFETDESRQVSSHHVLSSTDSAVVCKTSVIQVMLKTLRMQVLPE